MTAALRRLHRKGEEQPRLWLDWTSGLGVDPDGRPVTVGARADVERVCAAAWALGARVVAYTGERPGGDAEGFHRWRTPHDADVWVTDGAPYLRDLLTPVLHYRHRGGGGQVTVRSSGEWFGDHHRFGPAVCHEAIGLVRAVLEPRFYGARIWASPMATGTDLVLRALPEGGVWEPLPAEVAAQIHATTTQGRTEMWPAFDHHPTASAAWSRWLAANEAAGCAAGQLPRLVEYDGRFMYAALCADLPEGPMVEGAGWPDPAALGYTAGTEAAMVRGRFLVEWRPPKGWDQVGLLPHLTEGGWRWPTDHRWRKGWVNGAELWVALRWGWELKCRRHLAWARGRARGPLGRWADLLVAARDHVDLLAPGTEEGAAARAALRAITLTTIGVMVGRGHEVTRTAPLDAPLPKGRLGKLRAEGDSYIWGDDAGPARPEFAHPEWADTVWSRCRARLLDGPAVAGVRTGALHVDPAAIVAFSVDALYLAADPGWPDDHKAGRLRRQAVYEGPIAAPADRPALLALLRDRRKEPSP